MITAIIGEAFITVIFGIVADVFSLMAGFMVPIICLIYILIVAFKPAKK
jgi:fucose permease